MGVPVSLSLSLGATCPFIIFESAEIDSAVDGGIETAFKKTREVKQMSFFSQLLFEAKSVSQKIPVKE
jgi:hypothetical protein